MSDQTSVVTVSITVFYVLLLRSNMIHSSGLEA